MIDEPVVRIDDEQYWLYAAVGPDSNEVLHTKLETTRTNAFAEIFLGEHREIHAIDDAVFLVDDAASLREARRRHGFDFRDEWYGNRRSVERVFRDIKRRTDSFSNCFGHADPATVDDWLKSFAFIWNKLI